MPGPKAQMPLFHRSQLGRGASGTGEMTVVRTSRRGPGAPVTLDAVRLPQGLPTAPWFPWLVPGPFPVPAPPFGGSCSAFTGLGGPFGYGGPLPSPASTPPQPPPWLCGAPATRAWLPNAPQPEPFNMVPLVHVGYFPWSAAEECRGILHHITTRRHAQPRACPATNEHVRVSVIRLARGLVDVAAAKPGSACDHACVQVEFVRLRVALQTYTLAVPELMRRPGLKNGQKHIAWGSNNGTVWEPLTPRCATPTNLAQAACAAFAIDDHVDFFCMFRFEICPSASGDVLPAVLSSLELYGHVAWDPAATCAAPCAATPSGIAPGPV